VKILAVLSWFWHAQRRAGQGIDGNHDHSSSRPRPRASGRGRSKTLRQQIGRDSRSALQGSRHEGQPSHEGENGQRRHSQGGASCGEVRIPQKENSEIGLSRCGDVAAQRCERGHENLLSASKDGNRRSIRLRRSGPVREAHDQRPNEFVTYDDWNPIWEWDASGNAVAANIYGARADEIIGRSLLNMQMNGALAQILATTRQGFEYQHSSDFISEGNAMRERRASQLTHFSPSAADAAIKNGLNVRDRNGIAPLGAWRRNTVDERKDLTGPKENVRAEAGLSAISLHRSARRRRRLASDRPLPPVATSHRLPANARH